MCYFVTVATPLTLSEIRSMLAAGLSAQPVGAAEAAGFRRLHPPAQTVAVLLAGACSCDLVRARGADPREDERHLRSRYFQLRLTREQIIRELERHRQRPGRPEPPAYWFHALAAFVAEHGRNAGPTLYLLRFRPAALPATESPAPPVSTATIAEVRRSPEAWLVEDRPTLVVR